MAIHTTFVAFDLWSWTYVMVPDRAEYLASRLLRDQAFSEGEQVFNDNRTNSIHFKNPVKLVLSPPRITSGTGY